MLRQPNSSMLTVQYSRNRFNRLVDEPAIRQRIGDDDLHDGSECLDRIVR